MSERVAEIVSIESQTAGSPQSCKLCPCMYHRLGSKNGRGMDGWMGGARMFGGDGKGEMGNGRCNGGNAVQMQCLLIVHVRVCICDVEQRRVRLPLLWVRGGRGGDEVR